MSNLNPTCMICLDPCGLQDNFNEFRKHLFALTNYVQLMETIRESDDKVPKITVCETCQNHLKRFSDLLKALQIAEMKVDSCLKDIQNVMTRNPKNAGTEEMGTFRGNLIEKTSAKLRRSRFQPIITIEKTRISRISTVPVSQIETPSEVKVEPSVKVEPKQEETDYFETEFDNVDNDSDVETDEDRNVDKESKQQNEEENDTKFLVEQKVKGARGRWIKSFYCLHCKIKVRHGERHLQVFHKISSGNDPQEQLKCPYCRAHFKGDGITGIKKRQKSSWTAAWDLRHHIFQYHCEHYFPTHRLESISLFDFQKIVLELLFQDLIEDRASCAYCPRPFRIPSKQKQKIRHFLRIKMHYVESHFKIIEEKLKEIQEDPDLQEKLSKCNPEGRQCDLCGIYLMNLFSQVGHRKLHCKFTQGPKLFKPVYDPMKKLPVSETDVEGKVKCNLCGIIITREWAKHHVNNHYKCSATQRNHVKPKMKRKRKVPELKFITQHDPDLNREAMEIDLD